MSQNNSPNQSSEIALPPPPPLNETIVNAQPITQPKSPIPYVKPSPVTPPPKLNTVPTLDTLKSITTQETAINTVPSPSTSEITEELNNVKYDYTLIGVVQLPNNKSFALFKNNNLTEKVSVGKEIGTSGWVLMAINEQQAVISYQNESKNLRVGEKF